MQTLIITIVGQDKPGIVDQVSRLVVDHQGNWLASNLSKMAGQFAGIVQVTLPAEQVNSFQQSLDAISGLQNVIIEDQTQHTDVSGQKMEVELTGNDRPGIVQDVTAAVHQAGASILKMQSHCESAANWGGELFKAKMVLQLSDDCDSHRLQDKLESVTNDLVVDLNLVTS